MGMKVSVDEIVVREDRQRREFDDEYIESLARSMEDIGLIHSIVVERDSEKKTLTLIAGECRLRAAKRLGWGEIEVTLREECDEYTLEMIQLEENIRRRNLTWQEEVGAKLRLHTLYQSKYGETVARKKGGHRLVDTAEILGEAEGGVKMDIQLAKAMQDDPTLGEKETKSAAYKAMRARSEFDFRSQIAQILAEDSQQQGRKDVETVLGDSLSVLRGYPDDSFDFCVTDPPYGVDVDRADWALARDTWGEVRVDGSRELSMQKEIFKEVYRVLRDGAHCYVFYANLMHQATLEMLVECGFTVRGIPLIWHKSRGLNLFPQTSWTTCYESIFFAHKGKPKTFGFTGPEDVLTYSTPSKKVHPTEKPVALIKYLIENCSVKGEIGVDPFAGSGTFGQACQELGRRAVQIEKDPEYYTRCLEKLESAPQTSYLATGGEIKEERRRYFEGLFASGEKVGALLIAQVLEESERYGLRLSCVSCSRELLKGEIGVIGQLDVVTYGSTERFCDECAVRYLRKER
jgi:adenine-specific DNA-methyltransferase